MGVVSVLRDVNKIASEVGQDLVALVSCNNCVRACGSGGEVALPKIKSKLENLGVRIEETVLVTNLCQRGYLENKPLSPAVKSAIVFSCSGAQAGFASINPNVKMVPGTDSVGLMINSGKEGRVKVVAPFPGFEKYRGREFKLGDTCVEYQDQIFTNLEEV